VRTLAGKASAVDDVLVMNARRKAGTPTLLCRLRFDAAVVLYTTCCARIRVSRDFERECCRSAGVAGAVRGCDIADLTERMKATTR